MNTEIKKQSAYASAGVNIDTGNRAVSLMKDAVLATYNENVLSELGSFGGLFSVNAFAGLQDPVLVATTDGVGTKVVLSAAHKRYQNIGRDIVNHCLNDILVQGARPLFFMDYIASDVLDPEMVADVVAGMATACQAAGCVLLGGETAEMPGVYSPGHFDVVGTLVGVVDKEKLLPRSDIHEGDALLGIASSGPHTNGFSLIRKVFMDIDLAQFHEKLGGSIADQLLEPHRAYSSILRVLEKLPGGIKGMAHITGGGFFDNIPRILPDNLGAIVNLNSWPVPALFELIQETGEITEQEMYRVFNMGIGLVLVVSPGKVKAVQSLIPENSWVIGQVIPQPGVQLRR